jgi:hypothetical protein
MQDSQEIHQAKLANICLPATHDSGTFKLKHRLTPDKVGTALAAAYNHIQHLAEEIDATGVGQLLDIDPLDWLCGQLYPALNGLTCATTRDIERQLEDGIRCLDLRAYYDFGNQKFYTWHGLVGSRLDDILDSISRYLWATSADAGGEIVYITVGHAETSSGDNDEFPYQELADLLIEKLGAYLYVPTYDSDTDKRDRNPNNDPFQQTYAEIVGTGGTAGSRAIVAYGKGAELRVHDNKYADYFWTKAYSPPDGGSDGSDGGIFGSYSDRNDLDVMLHEQEQRMRTALTNDSPFALYLTLTPSDKDFIEILLGAASGIVSTLAAMAAASPIPGSSEIAAALEAIAIGLQIYERAERSWTTLAQLEAKITDHVERLTIDRFVAKGGTTQNHISMIYLDFYESTRIVDLAIRLSGVRTLDWVGNHSLVFTGNPSATSTSSAPALAVLDGQPVAVYYDDGALYQATATYFEDYSVWSGGMPIAVAGQNLTATSQPTLTELGGTLWLAYLGGKGVINLACFDGSSWSSNTSITINGNSLQSAYAPALVSYRGQLYLFFRGTGSDTTIHLATSADGTSWSGGASLGPQSNFNPCTSNNPTAAVHDDQLFLFYLGAQSQPNSIYFSIFDDAGWRGDMTIFEASGTINPQTTSGGPGAASIDGILWLVYRGQNHTSLYATQLKHGKWSGNQPLSQLSSISPESSLNPALVSHEGGLCMIYKGVSNTLYSAAYLPNPCEWSGNQPLDFAGEKPTCVSTTAAPALTVVDRGASYLPELWTVYQKNDDVYSAATESAAGNAVWQGGYTFLQPVNTAQSPAMATYYDKAYIAWPSTSDGVTLYQLVTDLLTIPAPVPIAIGGTNVQSGATPALELYRDLLYMVYRGTDSDTQLYMATFDAATSQWSGGSTIASLPGGVAPTTNVRPALAVHGTRLFLCWLDASDDQTLCAATFDGREWAGGASIGTLSNGAISPRSSDAPAMLSFRGRLSLFYKAASTNTLYTCWYADEKWSGDLPLGSIMSGATPSSPYGPAAAAFNGSLCLVYADPSGKCLDCAVFQRDVQTAEAPRAAPRRAAVAQRLAASKL